GQRGRIPPVRGMDGRGLPAVRPPYRGTGTVRPARQRHRTDRVALRAIRPHRGASTRQPPTSLLAYRVDPLRQTPVAVIRTVAPTAPGVTVTARNAWRAVPRRDWRPPGF